MDRRIAAAARDTMSAEFFTAINEQRSNRSLWRADDLARPRRSVITMISTRFRGTLSKDSTKVVAHDKI